MESNFKKSKRTINRSIVVLITISIIFAVILVGTFAEPSVKVDADDVVKITKIVNYQDKMGNVHYGAKMNIIVFKRKG